MFDVQKCNGFEIIKNKYQFCQVRTLCKRHLAEYSGYFQIWVSPSNDFDALKGCKLFMGIDL